MNKKIRCLLLKFLSVINATLHMFLYILPQSLLKILLCLAINVKQFSNLLIIIVKIGLLHKCT